MSQTEARPPASTNPPSRSMQLVGERHTPEPTSPSLSQMIGLNRSSATTPTATASSPPVPPELIHRAAWKAGVMGALNVVTALLAARLILLVAVVGEFVLAWTALANPDPYRIAALMIYATVVVVPLVWLAAAK